MSKFIVSICILSLVGNVKKQKEWFIGESIWIVWSQFKKLFLSSLKKKIMKAMKFSFMRSIAVWWWMFYVPLLFVVFNIWFPTLFEFETVEHVVQLITWIITFLFFMFIVAVVMKDNIEINRNKEDSISLFDCFIAISCFFYFDLASYIEWCW